MYERLSVYQPHCANLVDLAFSAAYFGEEGKISELVMSSQHATAKYNPS
jgi:hypothetical protein